MKNVIVNGHNACVRPTDYSVLPHEVDPYTGQVSGIKHGPCRSCGKRKIISVATLLCATESCLRRRMRRAGQ